jgi:shikimate dehydrogenase
MRITARTKICIVIGDPVEHSMSPQIHNAGYESLGIDDKFVFVGAHIKPEYLEIFIRGVKAMGIRGVSCTLPHKFEIMRYLDEIDPVARTIGAVNTVVNDGDRLKGYNSDWIGIVASLEAVTTLDGKNVALLGAGGAAHAAAYGLTNRGAHLTIYNRTVEKARQLAEQFNCEARPLDSIGDVRTAEIVVNTTSIGLPPNDNATPLPAKYISPQQIIFDTVYTAHGTTRLLKEAEQQGAQTIPGTEMLLQQGLAQFKLFAGYEAPEAAMRDALLEALKARGDS